ncbi:hypothetical protein [Chitinivorax sp. B]|uniref:hypothetical protein n=1 Tax=Chitinivorax sp. B TaxID=2502235 RepID=UPI0010F9605A|nr:hypothetical protein [Chitinivorax sp. B]
MLWIRLAAAIATFGVTIHLAAIAGGPSWYAFFGAPPLIVASAREGTWLAPVSTAGIAALMGICAIYACSASGLVRRLPLLRPMLASMAAVCLIRGFILIPLAINHPELRNAFEVIAAIVWATAGAGFAVGFRSTRVPQASRE